MLMCYPVGSPPSLLVLLHSSEARLWSIEIGLCWLAFLITGFCLWRFLPNTNPWRNVLLSYLLTFWYLLYATWLTNGVSEPFQDALSAWVFKSLAVLQEHHCSLAAYNALNTQEYQASTNFEFLTSVAGLGGFLVVATGVIALNFRRVKTAVGQNSIRLRTEVGQYTIRVRFVLWSLLHGRLP